MDAAIGPWRPLPLEVAGRLLAGLDAPWWVAGGWAIDLFVGRQTRTHGDLDIAMRRRDQAKLRDCLDGWDLQVAADGVLSPWAEADWLEGGARHQLWGRPSPDQPWALEILLEESDGDDWLYRRDPAIRMGLTALGRNSLDGTPFLCPEVTLLYKSNHPEIERNEADLAAAAPMLDPAARRWLASHLAPAHPWSRRLRQPT